MNAGRESKAHQKNHCLFVFSLVCPSVYGCLDVCISVWMYAPLYVGLRMSATLPADIDRPGQSI